MPATSSNVLCCSEGLKRLAGLRIKLPAIPPGPSGSTDRRSMNHTNPTTSRVLKAVAKRLAPGPQFEDSDEKETFRYLRRLIRSLSSNGGRLVVNLFGNFFHDCFTSCLTS